MSDQRDRLITCPSCKGTGGPINWSWRPGVIEFNVPCPLCKTTGQIVDRRAAGVTVGLDPERLPIDRLSDADVQFFYAAYETVMGDEARTTDGMRRIVEPLYRAASDIRLVRLVAAVDGRLADPEPEP